MNNKTKSIIITLILVIILFFFVWGLMSNYNANIGGVNKLYLPFPIKITSCGSSYDLYTNCTYPLIWLGIIESVIFWIVVISLSYIITRRIIKDR
jgi:hypothetical protein